MSGRFEDKVAIVTGGASGIGKSTCIAFARQGAKVTVVDVQPGETVLAECRQAKGDAIFVRADVSREQDARKVVEETVSAFGKVDCLVNNAASFIGTAETIEDWERSFGVNVFGAAELTRASAEIMKQGAGGAVVNVASISGYIAQPNHWTYNSSKGALLTLTKCMALDLAPWHIRVNSVSPGYVWTPPTATLVAGDREKMDAIAASYQMIPRCAEPEEVALALLFLCSDDASFITGTDLRVDGGYLGMGPEASTLSPAPSFDRRN